MVDAVEHVIKFYIMIILPLAIILWAIGSRFKDLDKKIIELEDKINKLENKKRLKLLNNYDYAQFN